jgi:carbonic anhydrase
MEKILNGLRRFQEDVFPEEEPLFRSLAGSQSPEALFLTCSDSRIMPGLMTQTKPGDLFICRNAGNIVPPYGEPAGGVSATIEYAVMALNVRDIIVCGHSDCGAMKGLLYPEKLKGMPTVAAWLQHAERARVVTLENFEHTDERQTLATLTEQNVLAQIDHLRTIPCVAARVQKGSLTLHGWVYEIETGVVRAYDAQQQRFVPIRHMVSQAEGTGAHAEVAHA